MSTRKRASQHIKKTPSTLPLIEQPLQYMLRQWYLLPKCDSNVHVGGCLDGKIEVWKIISVESRINQRTVQSTSGSIYRLVGPMDKERSLKLGIPFDVVKRFSRGFPVRWEILFLEQDISVKIQPFPEVDSLLNLSRFSVNKHNMMTRLKRKFADVASVAFPKSLDSNVSIPLCNLQVRRQKDQRTQEPHGSLNTNNTRMQPIIILTPLNLCEMPGTSVSVTGNTYQNENYCCQKRKEESAGKMQLLDTQREQQQRPKRVCRRTVSVSSQTSDFETCLNNGSRGRLSDSRNNRENVTISDNAPLPQRLRRTVRKEGSISVGTQSRQTRTSQPEKYSKGSISMGTQGRRIRTTKPEKNAKDPVSSAVVASPSSKKLRTKRKAQNSQMRKGDETTPLHSTTSKVKLQVECTQDNKNASVKENLEPKSPGLILNAKKGTLKRRKQIANILQHVARNHADDFFQSTPFKNKRQCFEFSPVSNWLTPSTSAITTPRLFPPSFQPRTVEKTTTSRQPNDVTFSPTVNERYLYRRSKWQKERIKKSKFRKSPAPSSEVCQEGDREKFFELLKADIRTKNDDDEEDGDLYFVCD